MKSPKTDSIPDSTEQEKAETETKGTFLQHLTFSRASSSPVPLMSSKLILKTKAIKFVSEKSCIINVIKDRKLFLHY